MLFTGPHLVASGFGDPNSNPGCFLSWIQELELCYQELCNKITLSNDYSDFLTNNPKLSEASKQAMEADLTLEELYNHSSGFGYIPHGRDLAIFKTGTYMPDGLVQNFQLSNSMENVGCLFSGRVC